MAERAFLTEAQELAIYEKLEAGGLSEAQELQLYEQLDAHSRAVAAQGRSTIETVDRKADIALSGFNEGLARFVGFFDPFHTMEELVAGARKGGFISGLEPETGSERILRRTGEEVGVNTLTLGTLGAISRTGIQGGRILGPMIEQFRRAPAATTAIETGLAASGGAGAGVAQEVAPGSTTAEIAGTVAGSLAPGTALRAGQTVGRVLTQGGRVAESALASVFPDSVFGRRAEKLAGPMAEKEVSRKLNQASRRLVDEASYAEYDSIRNELPEFRATTGAVTGDLGIAGLERAVASRSPDYAAEVQDLVKRNQDYLAFEMQRLGGDGNLATTAEDVKATTQELLANLDARVAMAEQRVHDELAKGSFPVDDAANKEEVAKAMNTIAENVRGELRLAKNQFDAQKEELLNWVDPEGKAKFLTNIIKGKVNDLQGRLRKADKLTKGEEQLFDIITNEFGRAENWSDMIALNRRINEEYSRLVKTPRENERALVFLGELKEAMEQTLDNIAKSKDHPNIAARYRIYKDYATEGARIFKRGSTMAAFRNPDGSPVPASETLRKFIHMGFSSKEDVARLKSAISGNPEAQGLVEDWIVRLAYMAAGKEGRIDRQLFGKFKQNYAEVLEAFPKARARLDDLDTAQASLDEAEILKATTQSDVDRQAAALFIKNDPAIAMQQVLKSKNPTADAIALARQAGQRGMPGLRAGFWEAFSETSPLKSPVQAQRFLDKHRGVMRAFGFSTADIARVRTILRAAEINSRIHVPTSVTPVDSSGVGLTLNQLLSRFYAVARGVVSARFVASEVGLRMTNRFLGDLTSKQAGALLERALIDPEVAKDIMVRITPENEVEMTRKLRTHLVNLGLIVAEDEE